MRCWETHQIARQYKVITIGGRDVNGVVWKATHSIANSHRRALIYGMEIWNSVYTITPTAAQTVNVWPRRPLTGNQRPRLTDPLNMRRGLRFILAHNQSGRFSIFL